MNTSPSYLENLNEQQREAVVYKDGPALVIAGAGSGKTRVLTYKIVDLIHNGFDPSRIMALTFTNKAAREMRERITGAIGERTASRLWMGTFHSIFLRILRRHAVELGFKPGFTIYDSADSRSLIKMIIKDMALDDKAYKPAVIASVISNAKNAMQTPDIYIADRDNYEADRKAKRPMTGEIYRQYYNRCRIANAMDFDDILVNMNILMRDFPDIASRYQKYFQYILVDEYQDTNFAQHLIVSQLAALHNRICVVGDDAQSIYSFRGADIDNILNLGKRYDGLKIFKLEQNYRSTKNIINAANSLIQKNTRQMRKNVFSENEEGAKVDVIKTYSDMEEAFVVANLIVKSKMTDHDSYDDYAILYRTNAQSRVIEEALRKKNISYRIFGGLSFYQRKEVKDMVAYFRLAVNPDDDEALKRIINYPARGIGETTLRKLHALASAESKSIWQALTTSELKDAGFNSGTISKLRNFTELIQVFIDDNESGANAYQLGQLIFNRTGILTLLAHDNTPESISRQENLSEILSGLKEFVDIRTQTDEGEADMRAFLSEIMLATDQDSEDDDNLPKVNLMTTHAAKGLEFKHVYVVGVEEDLFPSAMSQNSLKEVEEERRLLYVAITRAEKTCTLTYAGSRFRNGATVMTSPSRFLSEIDNRFLKMQMSGKTSDDTHSFVNPTANYFSSSSYSSKPSSGYSKTGSQPAYAIRHTNSDSSQSAKSDYQAPAFNPGNLRKLGSAQTSGIVAQHKAENLKVGMKIRHNLFGVGMITALSSISGEDSISVNFESSGEKKLVLKFAKFDII